MDRERSRLRPLAGLSILGVLLWRVGAGAFVDALRHVDARSVGVAVGIAVATTCCGAWRWVLVSRGLGAALSFGAAVAECYRSQFLNVTLPGGVLGDVHRGVHHGRGHGDVGRGLRSVMWERLAGQVVLGVLALAVVLLAPRHSSRPEPPMLGIGAGPAVLVATTAFAVAGILLFLRGTDGVVLAVRVVRAAGADVRAGLLGRHTWPGVAATSLLAVGGHAATFVLAARVSGVTAPVSQLLPLALVVLVAMGLPLNVAGWGPREGVAAWAFASAGLDAAVGVETAVVYGVMAFAAALPGAVLTIASRRRSPRESAVVKVEGAVHG